MPMLVWPLTPIHAPMPERSSCALQKVDPALIARFRPDMVGCFWSVFFFADHGLNRMVLLGRNALERALREYRLHYLRERNHQGLGNRLLDDFHQDADGSNVECRKRLGGLLRYYYRAAA